MHTHPPTRLDGARLAAVATLLSPAFVKRSHGGTGMSTRCPSVVACADPLGPTNPPRISLAAEPLDFRWWGFAPHFAATRSGSRTRGRSTRACARTSRLPRRSPTVLETNTLSFGSTLGPVTLSAHRHSTSELLRTLSRMAASKPTSWLSGRRHILSHSAYIWGP